MNEQKMRKTLQERLYPESEWLDLLLLQAIEAARSGRKGMAIPAHMSRSGILDFVTFPRRATARKGTT